MEHKETTVSSNTAPISTLAPPPSHATAAAPSRRGRPRLYDRTTSSPPRFPSSGKRSLSGDLFASTAGSDFTPHVVNVNIGEDVAQKILSLVQKGPREICILSANGVVSNAAISQHGSSGAVVTYEGRFEILSLTGSFTIVNKGGAISRSGGMSVSLAGPDGRVIGGGIAGLLIAASPIQIVVGSFLPNGHKAHKKKHQGKHALITSASCPSAYEPVTMATPISQVRPEREMRVIPASEFGFSGHNTGDASHATEDSIRKSQALNPTSPFTSLWNGSDTAPNQRPSSDIVTPASEVSGHSNGDASQATEDIMRERQALNAIPSFTSLCNDSDTASNERPSPAINILPPTE